jgi:hypothetical protein
MLQGESFYAHLADYLRFVLLFREGGVYTDMDSILLQPIDETNVIGVEHCDQDTLDYCIHLTQFSKSDRFYLPIGTLPLFLLHSDLLLVGFLVLAPSHPLIFGALSYFDTRYDPNLWPCGTIYLTLAYSRLMQSATDDRALVRILPREAFYPIPWQKVIKFPLALLSLSLTSPSLPPLIPHRSNPTSPTQTRRSLTKSRAIRTLFIYGAE